MSCSGNVVLMTLHVNLGPQLLEELDSSELATGYGTLELLYLGRTSSFASLKLTSSNKRHSSYLSEA